MNLNRWKVKAILHAVEDEKLAIPEFQRDFVWTANASLEFMQSVIREYPTGALLFLKTSDAFKLKEKPIQGCAELKKYPAHLILDGQQRITSVVQAFFNSGAEVYYCDLATFEATQDLAESLNQMKRKEWNKICPDMSSEHKNHFFPLHRLYCSDIKKGAAAWAHDYAEFWEKEKGYSKEKRLEILHKCQELIDNPVKQMLDYELPVIELSETTKAEAVCNIFTSLNRTGQKLTIFDLLTAMLYPDGIRLRDEWEEAKGRNRNINEFLGNSPEIVLQTMVFLARSGGKPSAKRRDLLAISAAEFGANWEKTLERIEGLLGFLESNCGVCDANFMPYLAMIPSLTVCHDMVLQLKHEHQQPELKKLQKLFWVNVFDKRYDASTDTQNAKDISAFKEWLDSNKEPDFVTNFAPDKLKLSAETKGAVVNAVMCLLMQGVVRDLYTGQKIDKTLILREGIDVHHIFPKAYLESKGGWTQTEINNAVNKTLISSKTNREIRSKCPSLYLPKILGTKKPHEFRVVLDSHAIEYDDMDSDNFKKLISNREKALIGRIKKLLTALS